MIASYIIIAIKVCTF